MRSATSAEVRPENVAWLMTYAPAGGEPGALATGGRQRNLNRRQQREQRIRRFLRFRCYLLFRLLPGLRSLALQGRQLASALLYVPALAPGRQSATIALRRPNCQNDSCRLAPVLSNPEERRIPMSEPFDMRLIQCGA